MSNPVPFRIKKGEKWSPWKALVQGKTVELGDGDTMTKEEAEKALLALTPSPPTPVQAKAGNLLGLLTNTESTVPGPSLSSTVSPTTTSPKTAQDEKPKPTELRKNGLAELTPARLAKFREQVAIAIAGGNVSLDRALVSIFRDKVPVLAPEQYMLLSTGWELACEQYFVNGVPPAWIIILLGNALVCTSLYEKSEAKPPEEEKEENDDAGTTGIKPNGTKKDKPDRVPVNNNRAASS
jgi:hypothetical protein